VSQNEREPQEELSPDEREKLLEDLEDSPAKAALRPARPRPKEAASHQLSSEVLEEEGSLGVPKRPMHDVVRTADDEVMRRGRARDQAASVAFESDPELNDPAADLAEVLGRDMLGAATSGVDMSELVPPEESFEEEGGPYIVSGLQAGEEDEEEYDLADIDARRHIRPGG